MIYLLILLLSPMTGNEITDPELLETIASKVRLHGFDCDTPEMMTHEDKKEVQGEHRWIISCDKEEKRYRVRLFTNNTSEVEKLN